MIRYLFLFLFALSVAAQTTTSPRTVNLPADLANVPIPITPPATRLTAILLGSVTVGDENAGTFYWDYSSSLPASNDVILSSNPSYVAIGRWLRSFPISGLSIDAIARNAGTGTNIGLFGSTFISNALITEGTVDPSGNFHLGYNMLTSFQAGNTDNAASLQAVADQSPLQVTNIATLLAVQRPLLGRYALVATGPLKGTWQFCPDELTPDNGTTVRRPDSISTDADAGRWMFVMGDRYSKTVTTMAELLSLSPYAMASDNLTTTNVAVLSTVIAQGYYAPGDGGGGTYILTNSITLTNAYGGKVVALGGTQSWQLVVNDKLNVRQFGAVADGATDNTLFVQAAIDYAEASGHNTVFFPASPLSYKWKSVTKHYCGFEGEYGIGYNGTILEQSVGATNHFIIDAFVPPVVPRAFQPSAGPQPSIKNFSIIGHSEANVQNPKAITAVTDRLNFSVATGDLPVTGGTTVTNLYPYLGHCFFYSSLNKYLGYGVITNINYGTGLITLMDHTDNYATPTNSGGIITNTMKVSFSHVVTETSVVNTETFTDGATAGLCGIYLTSTNATSICSQPLYENLTLYGFHCGIRVGTSVLARFKDILVKFSNYAGYADANPGNTRDGEINNLFSFGKYQPNYNTEEGGVTENVTYDNPGFRACSYGFFGQMTSGEMEKIAVNFCVNGWYSRSAAATRVTGCLVESVIGPALWLDGSKFGSGNNTMQIADFEFRSLDTNQVAPPTLTSWTNIPVILYRNSGTLGAVYQITTANFSRLSSTHRLADVGINMASSDGQFSILQIGRTNGISGNMLAVGSSNPAMLGRYNVNSLTGYTVQAGTFQVFGVTYGQISGPSTILRLARTDASVEANFNLAGAVANWTGTGLTATSFESSGGLLLKDTDANRNTFIRSLVNGSSTLYSSMMEPSLTAAENGLAIGGGSSGAFAATRLSFYVADSLAVTTGTELVRMNTNGIGIASAGGTGASVDALIKMDSTTQGFLPPRMTSTQRDAISSPTDGLVIYNTTTSKLQVRAGGAWVDLH